MSEQEKLDKIYKAVQQLTDKQVTRQELADAWGVDPVTIDNYRKKGLKRLRNGKFALNESLDWLYENTNTKKEGK